MKKAIIIIGAVIAIVLIVLALLPSNIRVERSVTINAPVDLVFDQVSDFEKNWNWSPWIEKDPNMAITYGEIRSGMGASYSWTGNDEVGNGSLETIEWEENRYIKNLLLFEGMDPSMGSWDFESIYREDENGELYPDGTEVTWGIDAQLSWPIGRFFGLLMEGMIGPDFEHGLEKLKEVSESMPVVSELEVELTEVMSMDFLSIKDSVPISAVGTNMGAMYGEIIEVMKANGVELLTSPICFYHEWNEIEGYTIMEAAIILYTDVDIKLDGRVSRGSLSAGPAAKVIYAGNYNDLARAHYAIDEWMKENNREQGGAPWEMYVTGPQSEPDTNEWITEIFYPLL